MRYYKSISVKLDEELYEMLVSDQRRREHFGEKVTINQVVIERLASTFNVDTSDYKFNKRKKPLPPPGPKSMESKISLFNGQHKDIVDTINKTERKDHGKNRKSK